MTLYEINAQIKELIEQGFTVDEETGEILSDLSALEDLEAAREEKIENILLYYKNLTADAKAIREEEKRLAERRKALENKAARLKEYADFTLSGEKFSTPRVSVSYRKVKNVVINEEFFEWAAKDRPELLRWKAPEADKTAIAKLLKAGRELPGASIEEGLSMSIK